MRITINRQANFERVPHGKDLMRITFPLDDDKTIFRIRSLPQRRFHPDGTWTAPIYPDSIRLLQEWGFVLDQRLKDAYRDLRKQCNKIGLASDRKVNGSLFPYQKKGVEFIEQNNGRALVADEMGLGKTIQALAWLEAHPQKRVAIIVVPASLKLDWKEKAEQWMTDPKIEVVSGTKPYLTKGKIIIINYDILPQWQENLKQRLPEVLILDEAHYIKANSAKRTKAVKMLARNIPHVIALTGTPILNRPIEIYNTIRILNPELFPSYPNFVTRYCDMKRTPFGMDVSGHSHTEELHSILSGTLMIRRLKKDVLTELPEKLYSFTPIELSNKVEYKKAEDDFIEFIRQKKGVEAAMRASAAEALTKTETLRQLAAKGKMKYSIEWIRDFLDNDEKLVVFCIHKEIVDILMREFGPVAVKIDGSVTPEERQEAKLQFQTDPKIRLFVGNIRAAGEGITLTASSNVAFIEYPWSPGQLLQCEDRCHRIGQKNNVTIHYLMAAGTIDEKIARLLDRKKAVISQVADGQEVEEKSLLTELLRSYE